MNKLPTKLRDPGSFSIPCSIGNLNFSKALCDLGASVSILPLSIAKKLGLHEIKPTGITLQLADRSIRTPVGVLENVLMKVKHLFIPIDFVVLEIDEDSEIPIILGRPFLATAGVIINVRDGKLSLRVGEEVIEFNLFATTKFHDSHDTACSIDIIEEVATEFLNSEFNENLDSCFDSCYDESENSCSIIEPFSDEVLPCFATNSSELQQEMQIRYLTKSLELDEIVVSKQHLIPPTTLVDCCFELELQLGCVYGMQEIEEFEAIQSEFLQGLQEMEEMNLDIESKCALEANDYVKIDLIGAMEKHNTPFCSMDEVQGEFIHLLNNLDYVSLNDANFSTIIMDSSLTKEHVEKLLKILKLRCSAMGWKLSDFEGD